MQSTDNLRGTSKRIEALLNELGRYSDTWVREKAQELARLLMELYGAGLRHILEIIDEAGQLADPLFDRLCEDDLVSGLLVLHGLHPLDTETRITRALNRLNPYLNSQGVSVKSISVNDAAASVLMEPASNGCFPSKTKMKLAIEQAIQEAAPEVTHVEIEGIEAAPMLLSIGPLRSTST